MQKFELEVCVERSCDAMVAVRAGATRIELNSHLELDGLTPELNECHRLIAELADWPERVPVVAMLRPHNCGFVYSQAEQQTMLKARDTLLECGVEAFACGALTNSRELDFRFMRQLVETSPKVTWVMHRAFDAAADQITVLLQLIELGISRILTSGGAPTAEAGMLQLRRLHELASEKIEILPGAGINSRNADAILRSTGCRQLHGSFRQRGQQPIRPDCHEIAHVRKLLDARQIAECI